MLFMGVLIHWTQANIFELVVRQNHGCPQGGQDRGDRPPWNLQIKFIHHDCVHRRTGKHFTGGTEKICPENNFLV